MDSNQNLPSAEKRDDSCGKSTATLVKEFCEYTSCGGLGRVVGAKYIIHKILWFLLFAGALAIGVVQLLDLYKKYQRKPVSTTISIKSEVTLPFPSITFCNFNPVRKSKLSSLPSAARLSLKDFTNPNKTFDDINNDKIKSITTRTSTEAPKRLRTGAYKAVQMSKPSKPTSLSKPTPTVVATTTGIRKDEIKSNPTTDPKQEKRKDEKKDKIKKKDIPRSKKEKDKIEEEKQFAYVHKPEHLNAEYKSMEKISVVLARMAKDHLQPLGHQFNESVLDCTYRGVDCKTLDSNSWMSFWHYKYGNCYVFNPGKKQAVKRSNKPGPFHGLDLKLYVDQDNYVDQLTHEAGYRIVITPQGPMPFPFEEGINVPPGYSTSIGLRKVLIKRADPFNNRSCSRTDKMDEGNLYSSYFNATYSNTACKESCLAHNQYKLCGCMEYRFPAGDSTPVCDVLDNRVVSCLNDVQKLFRQNELNCSTECHPPCVEEYFKLTTSMSAWPSKNYEIYLYKQLKSTYESGNYAPKIDRDNILSVRIFYEELNYEVIEETLSYELVDFLSDIGGQLGLWLGVSALTAAEVVELILLIFYKLCDRSKKKHVARDSDMTNPSLNDDKVVGETRF